MDNLYNRVSDFTIQKHTNIIDKDKFHQIYGDTHFQDDFDIHH